MIKARYAIEPPADLSTLPDPPVPDGLDLRHFDWMHLHTEDLLESPIWDVCSDAEIATALRLWAKAWQQVPCSSLPNDVAKIREWAGCAGKFQRWKMVKGGALRGFSLCKDGRLYHHKVAEAANNAASKSRAGKRGAKSRWDKVNALKTHNSANATAYDTGDSRTDDTLYSNGDGRPHGKQHAEKGREYSSPLPPSLSGPGSGSLEAPPARSSTSAVEPPADPEFVEVTIDSGAKLRVTRRGSVDEIWAPRDCPTTMLTPAQALQLYADAVAAMKPPRPALTTEAWLKHLGAFDRDGTWPAALGPGPDQPGCVVPDAALAIRDHARATTTQPDDMPPIPASLQRSG